MASLSVSKDIDYFFQFSFLPSIFQLYFTTFFLGSSFINICLKTKMKSEKKYSQKKLTHGCIYHTFSREYSLKFQTFPKIVQKNQQSIKKKTNKEVLLKRLKQIILKSQRSRNYSWHSSWCFIMSQSFQAPVFFIWNFGDYP